MEQMRQGQGIIDIVNTYLQFALPYGLIGLSLFALCLLAVIRAVLRGRRLIVRSDTEAERLGRILLGAMAGILVTIATVSSIGVIAPMYWLMSGICVAYGRLYAGLKVAEPQLTRAAPNRREPQTHAAPLTR
jgi:O-antigen ligase